MTEDTPVQMACPKCGSTAHLYRDAAAKWCTTAQDWIVTHVYDEMDCSDCDWSGYECKALPLTPEGAR